MANLTIDKIAKRLNVPTEKLLSELSANKISVTSNGLIAEKDKNKLIFFIQSKTQNSENVAVTRTVTQNIEHGKNKVKVQTKRQINLKPTKKEEIDEEVVSKTSEKTNKPSTADKKIAKKRATTTPKEKTKNNLADRAPKTKPIEPVKKANLNNKEVPTKKISATPNESSLKDKLKRKKRLILNDEKNVDVKTLKGIYFNKLNEQEGLVDNSELSLLKNKSPATKNVVNVKTKHGFQLPQKAITKEIELPQHITVKDLAKKLSIKPFKVLKSLASLGEDYQIDNSLDFDTAYLVVGELGYKATAKTDLSPETELSDYLNKIDRGESKLRAPVVTIMGHVDHGKTTLLDNIRKTNVADGEAGSITQHLSAYHVNTNQGVITFIDTPGHAAFTAMRARGSKFTDIVVLIIAADDGVMPQTIEIIQHVKASNVPIIVAINKIDRQEASRDKVLQDLAKHDIVTESWGGTIPVVDISALSGKGVNSLLETISLQAEIMELMAPVKGAAKGFVLECTMQQGLGIIVSLIVQQGQLKQGDIIISGTEFGKVRSLNTSDGQKISQVGPSIPVEITGFSNLPNVGDAFVAVSSEKIARTLCNYRKSQTNHNQEKQTLTLENLLENQAQADNKQVNLIIKADTQGSCEALTESLLKLSNDKVMVQIVAQGVGGIRESDATLAMIHQALIIGFNVRADTQAKVIIEKESLSVNYYSIIYDVVDTVEKALLGQLEPEFKESIIGIAEVRSIFRARRIGAVAGCMVIEGEIKRHAPFRVLRDEVVIYEGELESLRRFKENVSSVRNNTECGIGVKNYADVREGDLIEVFEKIEIKPTMT